VFKRTRRSVAQLALIICILLGELGDPHLRPLPAAHGRA